MIRILLVDDHAVVRTGYRRLIETRPHLYVVAEADRGSAAYRRVLQGGVDVVVLDLSLPGIGGLEVVRRLHQRAPDVRVLVFSMHEEPIFVQRAFAAGACGYLSKCCGSEHMIHAIDHVAAGRRYVSPGIDIAREQLEDAALSHLSQREFEVFRQIASGRSVRDIAGSLQLSGKTIANYYTQVRSKLGANNAADLARLAVRAGVVAA
jgi:DNA-binding NarL/FixJ family response regulator